MYYPAMRCFTARSPMPDSSSSPELWWQNRWAPRCLTKRKGLPLFQSHGTQDPILPFNMAERLRDEFLQAGVTVEERPLGRP